MSHFFLFHIFSLFLTVCHSFMLQEWLLSWLCLTRWPLQLGEEGEEVGPCPLICSIVQEHCPFNIIMEDASMAGGDPTFLCEGDEKEKIGVLPSEKSTAPKNTK
jgi:hypothetical protein